ncbi:DUF6461 domain-containing protein [Streptoalloteichus hindustanus]|uniref:DUF6461 domain-containing protein n=1 Tax=Streptoalloteichus hindustanus TaxID=2017 RepID=UPI00093752FF|nr:DUF6461 domain-containing protein [Streptoalloteichus hindustanus]
MRADAVAHYATLLDSEVLPSEALCLTAVCGLSVREGLARFGAGGLGRETTLGDAGLSLADTCPEELRLVVVVPRDGWLFLVEDNGFHGARSATLSRLSRRTVAASVYWNANLDSAISLAQDGEVLATCDFVVDDEMPAGALRPFLDGLDFGDADLMCAAAVAFLERGTSVRLDADWSVSPHIASVIASPE